MDCIVVVGKYVLQELLRSARNAITDVANLSTEIEEMKNRLTNLDSKRNKITDDLKRARRKAIDVVEMWMDEVEKARNEVDDIKKDFEQVMQNRLLGFCPNFYIQFIISRRVRECNTLLQNLENKVFSEGCSGPPLLEYRHTNYIKLDSFEKKKSQIETWLTANDHESVRLIGVKGRSGTGKTILLTEIYNSDDVRKSFHDNIFWIDLSPHKVDMESIQKYIVTKLGLPEISGTESLKHTISSYLSKEKFLLILDDLQNGCDIQKLCDDVGVPSFTRIDEFKYKIVFSWKDEIYKSLPFPQAKGIEMNRLSDEERCELFRRAAFGGQPLSQEMTDDIHDKVCIHSSFERPADIYDRAREMQVRKYGVQLSEKIDAEILVHSIAMSVCVCFFLLWQLCGVEKMVGRFSFLCIVFVATITFAGLPWMNNKPETEKRISTSSKEKAQEAVLEETSDVLEKVLDGYAEIPEFHGGDRLLNWKPGNEGLATCNDNFGETANPNHQEIENGLLSDMEMTLEEKLPEEVGCSRWYEGSDDTHIQAYGSPLSKQEAEENGNPSDEETCDTDGLLF